MSRILCCLLLLSAASPALADVDAASVMETLKTLEGTWEGEIEAVAEAEMEEEAKGNPVQHVFRVSSNGTVVQETMNPGTEHEMINMYHLDGDELVITHYCAGGNQPTMRLDRAAAKKDSFPFVFTGGTNFDPAVDGHIHEGSLRLIDAETIESVWIPFHEGKRVGETRFVLKRVDDAS